MDDRGWAARVAIGAGCVGLAVAMTGCGGAKKHRRTDAGASTTPAASTGDGPLNCTDPTGDVKGGRGAPAGTDLSAVSWTRTGEGATVVFTTAGAADAGKGSPAVTYTTSFAQGAAEARVDARRDGDAWRVTSSGPGKTAVLKAAPRAANGTVTLDLPRRLPAGDRVIDLSRRADVGAATRSGAYGDIECGRGATTRTSTVHGRKRKIKRHLLSWPVLAGGPSGTARRPSSGSGGPAPTRRATPPSAPRKSSGTSGSSGSGSRPSRPRGRH
ncbi:MULTISPECIES: hypothetical protein [Actinomadura]|uniref:Uncharacterized protein n=1 Tax=Actinomadura yumaensis TaxID=111807 RepID=A0ABW2CR05_9ACTN|nr:hypothetical protein [Actinomadura sp. J1-007]MWK35463.1 hypothetical protein [Actinomadura sp. J1-007]